MQRGDRSPLQAGSAGGAGEERDRQLHGEGAPPSRRAGDRDVSSERARQAADDAETQPRSARAPSPRIDLPEGVEGPLQMLGRDPDPGVGHAQPERSVLAERGQPHLPSLRVLDRVGGQVQHDPTQHVLVGEGSHSGGSVQAQGQPGMVRERLHDAAHVFQEPADLHPHGARLGPRLEPAEREQLVDQMHLMLGRFPDALDPGQALGAELILRAHVQQIRVPDDRIERGTQVVRDDRDEIRLRLVRRARGLIEPGVVHGQGRAPREGTCQRDIGAAEETLRAAPHQSERTKAAALGPTAAAGGSRRARAARRCGAAPGRAPGDAGARRRSARPRAAHRFASPR